MGLQIQFHDPQTRQDIDAVFAAFARERPDALLIASDTFSAAVASSWSI
jgi:hypothetical protein